MSERVRREVRISGEVQGVFYRDSCRQEARRLGVAGWVRNASDGSVAAVFEGRQDAVEALIRWCQRGPTYARVESVEVTEAEPGGISGFSIR